MKRRKQNTRKVRNRAKRNQYKISTVTNKTKQRNDLKQNKPKISPKVEVNTKVRYTKGVIDSINFSSPILTSVFLHNQNYRFERIKRGNEYNNYRWKTLFGGSLFNRVNGRLMSPFSEAYAIHSHTGVSIPMKFHTRNRKSPTIEFAGLHRYDRRSELLKMTLWDLFPSLQETEINRIDIAIDVNKRVQSKVHKSLTRTRVAKKYKNSVYYKTHSEKKRNPNVNIIIYDKGKKEGLCLENKLIRMEFQFSSSYLKKITLRNMDKAIDLIEKRMKRDTGLNIKVCPLF